MILSTKRLFLTFQQASYRGADMNAKLNNLYFNLFEASNKIYFEAGGSMEP